MLFRPKRTKFKKNFKGLVKGISKKGNILSFGKYGIKSLSIGRITEKQIESSRKSISNKINKSSKLWIRIFPNICVTKKPIESRMGKGKGDISHFICRIKPGRILFELDGISKEDAYNAFEIASHKLPVKTKFVHILDYYN